MISPVCHHPNLQHLRTFFARVLRMQDAMQGQLQGQPQLELRHTHNREPYVLKYVWSKETGLAAADLSSCQKSSGVHLMLL